MIDFKQNSSERGEDKNILTEKKDLIPVNTNSENTVNTNPENKNLVFPMKNIFIFQLWYSLDNKLDVFLNILSVIFSLGSGVCFSIFCLYYSDIMELMMSIWMGGIPGPMNMPDIALDELKKEADKKILKTYIISVANFVAGFIAIFLSSYIGIRQLLFLKKRYFEILLKQEQEFYDQINTYELSTKVQSQLEYIELSLGERPSILLISIGQLIADIINIYNRIPKLLLFQITSIIPFLLIYFLLGRLVEKSLQKVSENWEKAGSVGEEIVYNIKTVSSFSNFDYEKKRFDLHSTKVKFYSKKTNILNSLYTSLFYLVLYIYLFISTILGKNWKNNSEGANVFFALVAYLSLGDFFIKVIPTIKEINEGKGQASDYFSFLERTKNLNLEKKSKVYQMPIVEGNIIFNSIKFAYPSNKNKNIFDGLELKIKSGEKVAFVGESGSGKTTIINLIERFYKLSPENGSIIIDGVNINDYEINYLRNLIGYVPQEPVLFNKSIKYNIIFGREELIKKKGLNIDQLFQEACDNSLVNEFINDYKEKYDYIVGSKGCKLSASQRQRICIARALLLKPKILLLDEATSSLSGVIENEVQEAINKINEISKITIITVAHKLKAVKNTDIIYTFKEGKIIEKGKFEELVNLNGYFASMLKKEDFIENNNNNNLKLINEKENNENSKNEIKIYNQENEELIVNSTLQNENSEEISTKKLFSFLLQSVSSYKCPLIIGLFFSLGSGVLFSSIAYTFAYVQTGLVGNDNSIVTRYNIATFILAIGFSVAIFLSKLGLEVVGYNITYDLRNQMINKYLELDMSFYDKGENKPGALLTKLSMDTVTFSTLFSLISGNFCMIIGLIIFIICISYQLTGFIVGIFIGFGILRYVVLILANYTRRGNDELSKKDDIAAGEILSECVQNTKLIYSYNFQEEAYKLFNNTIYSGYKRNICHILLRSLFMAIGFFAKIICSSIVLDKSTCYLRNKTKKNFTFQDFVTTYNDIFQTINAIEGNIIGFMNFCKLKQSFKSIYSILETFTKIKPFNEQNKDKISSKNIKGKIEFKNVYFSYPSKPDINILENVSFIIPEGKSIGLVGLSGSGKSTILQLIERFYEPTKGSILIDDIEINKYNLYELRKIIGYLNQEPCLFKRNIYDNVLYGNLDANNDDVLKSVKNSKIDKFLEDDKIKNISGGEKQRLGIARIFIKNPRIYLWDEPGNSLDKENEDFILTNIKNIQKGKTSIIISNRLKNVINCDTILYFESGKLLEIGSHNDLIAKNGKYYKLYENCKI